MAAGPCIDQLRGDANLPAARLNAAFEHVVDAEVAPNGPHVGRFVLVNLGRIPRDHEQILRMRQVRDDVLGDPVGEALPGRIVADVFEWEHRDRGLVDGGR